MSLNVRGVGDRAKRSRIRSLISTEQLDLCLLQETKCTQCDDRLIASMWGGSDFEWVARHSNGLAGGLIIIWRTGTFKVQFTFSGEGLPGLLGCVEEY